MRRRWFAVLAAVLVVFAGAGCAEQEPEEQGDEEAAASTLGAIIIDVRTPEEFAAGHIDGAMLIDIRDGSFDTKIAELDPTASYIVYCRSGNRSAQAVARMREAGIVDITDLGSLENASTVTGIAIVSG